MRVHIRQIQSEDVPAVVRLIQDNLLNVNAKDYPPDVIQNLLSEYSVENTIARMQEFEGQVVAVVVMDPKFIVGTGAWKHHWEDPSTGYITGVFVSPPWHQQGFGRKIVEWLVNRIRKAGKTTIQLNSSLTAVPFYRKLGFLEQTPAKTGVAGEIVPMQKLLE